MYLHSGLSPLLEETVEHWQRVWHLPAGCPRGTFSCSEREKEQSRNPPAAVWYLSDTACFPTATLKLVGLQGMQRRIRQMVQELAQPACEVMVTCHL